MLLSALKAFRIANYAEVEYLERLWRLFGIVEPLPVIADLAIARTVAFTGPISAEARALENTFSGDRSLEGLADPDRFAQWHDAFARS